MSYKVFFVAAIVGVTIGKTSSKIMLL